MDDLFGGDAQGPARRKLTKAWRRTRKVVRVTAKVLSVLVDVFFP